MISYVKGLLMAIEEDVIVIEAGHVGLAVHVPVSLLPELPGMGKEVIVRTYFQARKDAVTLYGFLYSRDGDMSRQLLGISDIRPKGALGVLSVSRPGDLRLTAVNGDVKALAKAPGIGNETAQCLVLDLKDKIFTDDVLGSMAGGTDMGATGTGASMAGLVEAAREVVRTSVVLGYTDTEAFRVVGQVEVTDGVISEDALKIPPEYLSFLWGF